MEIFLLITGIFLLITGANFLIDGAVSIGRKAGMPSIVIGLTIVALGTSLPELVVSVMATIRNDTELGISNVLGSNTANILLVLGAAAIISPLYFKRSTISFEVPYSLMAILLLFALMFLISLPEGKNISRVNGVILLLAFLGFIVYSIISSRKKEVLIAFPLKKLSLSRSVLYLLIGLAGIYFGGTWIIKGVEYISMKSGWSSSTIGIKIVALSTSLPELVTSVIASRKKQGDIAIGNVIGSNIINILLVLGISAIIAPLKSYTGITFDMGIVILSTFLLYLVIYIGGGKKISRYEGGFFIVIYIIFVIFREKLIILF